MTPENFVEQFYRTHPDIDGWTGNVPDHIALIYLIEKYDIKTIFEFGTWRGCTTLLLYTHPNVKEVTTLDIHKDMGVAYTNRTHPLSEKEFYGSFFKGKPIRQIFCDSMKYKPRKKYDMVFIDGNHDYEYVKNDSELAFKMATKIIAWHDYRNGNPGVDLYLNELIATNTKVIIHLGGYAVAYMAVE